MKKSIMYLSYNTKYGAEKNDLYFFNFLKRKLYIDLFLLSDNFKAGYYSYDEKFKKDSEFSQNNIYWLKSKTEIFLKILKYDIILISGLDGASEFSKFCKKFNKRVIVLDSFFNQDFSKNLHADFILFKGNYSLKTFKRQSGQKKISYKICGCIQSVFIKKNSISRKNFLKKYQLNNRECVTLFPHGPQYLDDDFYIKTLKQIIKVLSKRKINLLINPHPTFFLKKKAKRFPLELFKKITKSKNLRIIFINPSDIYNSINYSKFSVSITSNVFQQVNLIKKPMIFVNRQSFYFKNKCNYNKQIKFKNYNIYKYNIDKNLIKNERYNSMVETQIIKDHMFFYGTDIDSKSLDKIFTLKKKCDLNSKKFKNHLRNITMYQDMKCYQKTSDLICSFYKKIKIDRSKKYKINFYKFTLKILVYLKKVKNLTNL